jgi:hypothetical protein
MSQGISEGELRGIQTAAEVSMEDYGFQASCLQLIAEVQRLQADNEKLLRVARAGKRMLNELINSIPSGMTAMELSFTLEAAKDLVGKYD